MAVSGGDGGIRTLVRLLPNWFRVSPVMTTSIRLPIYAQALRFPLIMPHFPPTCKRPAAFLCMIHRSGVPFAKIASNPHSSLPLRCRHFSLKSFWQNLLTFLARRANITKLTIYGGPCGCSTMVRAPAFQAGDAGSIPVTRSIYLRQ